MTEEQVNQDLEQLRTLLEESQKQAVDYLEGWKRAKADYLNYQKDQEKFQAEMIQFANAALLSKLFPVYENFGKAIKHIPAEVSDQSWVVGFSHIYNQLTDFFKSLGIEAIKTVGEKFDPNLHEALASEENDEHVAGLIFEEVASGYTLNGKVIVPAKVKVAK